MTREHILDPRRVRGKEPQAMTFQVGFPAARAVLPCWRSDIRPCVISAEAANLCLGVASPRRQSDAHIDRDRAIGRCDQGLRSISASCGTSSAKRATRNSMSSTAATSHGGAPR